jgi:hypothetical protein
MKNRVRLVIACAMVVGTSLAVVAPGGIAGAVKKPKQVTGTCSSLSGSSTSQNLSGCTDTADTGGSGTIAVSGSDYTTTWETGLTSTGTESYKEKFGKADKCPAPPPGETALAEALSTSVDTGGTATDLVGTKKFKGTACAYEVTSDSDIVVVNYPGKTIPF